MNDSNAILVDPENKDEWISAIEQLKNKTYRDKLGCEALKDFKKYTWKVRASELV